MVTNTAVLASNPETALAPGPPARAPARSVRLSAIERRAVGTLITNGAEATEEYADARASSYATGDPSVRVRSLSRAAVVHELQAQELAALLAQSIARRDLRAARVIDRVLSAALGRYQALLAQLRIETAPTRKISVTAKGVLAIAAEEQP